MDALRPRSKDYVFWDRDLPGFGVRVHASGRKVFVVQTRGPAGSKRLSIGHHGDLTVAEARNRARVFIRRIKRGEEPDPEPPAPQPTVGALAQRYLCLHAEPNCKSRTVELYRGVIDNHIVPALGDRAIGSVRRREIVALHQALHDRPGAANCTLQVLSQMFRKAEQWGLVPEDSNPCRSIRKYRLRARNRYLSKEEYRRLGRVLADGRADGSISAPAVAALRLLMLTGCRRDEILTLRWDDVDLSARELRLRDSKSGPCMVALTSAVARVLDGIPRVPGNPWVIVGEAPGRRLMTLKSTWRRVMRRAGLPDLRLHDLRHSYASRALAQGESLTIIGKLLNHAQIQSTARYAHLMADAEKAAAARVGDVIATHIAGQHASSRWKRDPDQPVRGPDANRMPEQGRSILRRNSIVRSEKDS